MVVNETEASLFLLKVLKGHRRRLLCQASLESDLVSVIWLLIGDSIAS